VRQDPANTVHFVVANKNTTNPQSQLFYKCTD